MKRVVKDPETRRKEIVLAAKEIFESSNPNYKIDLQKGGSGAGIAAAGMGLVDIGAASKDASGSFTQYPDLNRDGKRDLGIEMVQTTVGYDGVVIIVSKNFVGNLDNITKATMQGIYAKTTTDWNVVPCGIGSLTNVTGATSTPIKIADRSDESGTEECFVEKLIDIATGYSTFVSEKQIISGHCHISKGSNQELVEAIYADTAAIGFTAKGIADGNTDKVKVIPFSDDGSTLATGDGLPSASEIKAGPDEGWPGSRPLNFLTVGKPTGAAKVFIDFCLTPEANLDICELSDYVSLYA